MIGGIVIESFSIEDRVYINCRDIHYRDECAIYVERNKNSEMINFGDRIWWQGRQAFWTPADESRVKVVLKRIGYSGILHPTRSKNNERNRIN